MTSGKRAATHGRRLEGNVVSELDMLGYERIWPSSWIFAMRDMGQPVYAQQVVVGRTIYGKIRRVDFLLFHPLRHPNGLIIECKWQSSRGTVDEKYPFLVLNIARGEYDTIVILDGGGSTPASEQWLRGQAGQGRLKHVFSMGEFSNYASRGNI